VPVSYRQDFLPLSRSDIRCAGPGEENPKIDPNTAAAISGAPAWPPIGLPGTAAG
jgi:hypothetical protein